MDILCTVRHNARSSRNSLEADNNNKFNMLQEFLTKIHICIYVWFIKYKKIIIITAHICAHILLIRGFQNNF